MFKMSRSLNMSRRLSMSRKLPKIHMSKSILTNILYLITLVLAINFIMKKQISALLSLFLIAGLVYYFKKNITLALIVSIIATNLLIATKYLGGPKMENLMNNKPKPKDPIPMFPGAKDKAKIDAAKNEAEARVDANTERFAPRIKK